MVKLDTLISDAYEDVRNDKTETNWITVDYVDDKTDALKVSGKGTGGLSELKAKLKPENATFAFLRVTVGNDELSKRAKFVLISWCGSQVKVMRRAKLSVHIADVKHVIKNFAVEIAASSLDELDENELSLLVKKAMGANYDRQTSNY